MAKAVAVRVVVKLVKAVLGGRIARWDFGVGGGGGGGGGGIVGFGEDWVVLEEEERMAEGEKMVAMEWMGVALWQ